MTSFRVFISKGDKQLPKAEFVCSLSLYECIDTRMCVYVGSYICTCTQPRAHPRRSVAPHVGGTGRIPVPSAAPIHPLICSP